MFTKLKVMDYFVSLNHDLVFCVFVVLSLLVLAIKTYKFCRVKTNNDQRIKLIQRIYSICQVSFVSGFIFQGPYVYQMYQEKSLSSSQINNIMSVYNLTSAICSLFVGFLCEVMGHKGYILISAVILGMSSLCRYYGTYASFATASFLLGFGTASNRVVFEDWLTHQVKSNNISHDSIAAIRENNSFISLIVNTFFTSLSKEVSSSQGIGMVFLYSSLLFGVSFFMVLFLMNNTSIVSTERMSFLNVFRKISKGARSYSFILLLLIDLLYQLVCLLYPVRWTSYHKVSKDETIPLSYISTTVSICSTIGAQIVTSCINKTSVETIITSSFIIYSILLINMKFLFYNKNVVFLIFCLTSIIDGVVSSCISIMRSFAYPDNVRKYLMGYIRVPVSLFAVTFLQGSKDSGTGAIITFSAILISLCSLLSIVFTIKPDIKTKKNPDK